ncbi:MAG: PD-(D/E)XK nuclease family protein [Bacteroidales bacterium]|jgi:CRISPR/Cas system-associated exonuclease Cas4 (RecB family)|nr:PD-(D/E)XK nuclease family protein [Bacteroidales bacterium]
MIEQNNMTDKKDSSFLSLVAEDIIEKYKSNLQNLTVVFPNKRAIKFFLKEIGAKLDKPFLSPDILSINDLLDKYIYDFEKADELTLLYYLYKSYCKIYYTHNPLQTNEVEESFDEFYYWGKVILNDFDEIDKNLIDAKQLYKNLNDYKDLALKPEEYLSEEQISLINKLFNTDLQDKSIMIKKFVSIWNCLYEIYEDFNNSLQTKQLAYEGMLYKKLYLGLENKEIKLENDDIAIVGFSVLNISEKRIFKNLKENYTTNFYWDYDEYYYKDISNEAGIFIRENLQNFPMNDSFSKNEFNNIENNKQEINIISSPYESLSLSYIEKFLKDIDYKKEDDRKVAIILNDESLISLVIKSIPKEIEANITMGYPFKQSYLYGEITSMVSSLLTANKLDKENINAKIKEKADKIIKQNKQEEFWQLDVLKKINEILLSFVILLDNLEDKTIISNDVIEKVIKKRLSQLSVDMISDNTSGLQVMGLLETRELDFDYVLMLSTTDNNLPKVGNDSSFIPFSFKKAYNMMSVERKVGLFAYYFYRLFHKAKRLDFVYTTTLSDGKMKEMSRFLHQIKVEMIANKMIKEKNIVSDNFIKSEVRNYKKYENDFHFIDDGKSFLSPSNLNKLIDCKKMFYLDSVLHLREDVKDDNLLPIAFGNVFHKMAYLFYENMKNNNIGDNIDDEIEKTLNKALENPFDETENKIKYIKKQKEIDAISPLHKDILKKYLKDLFVYDREEKNEYLCGEKEIKKDLEINGKIIHFMGRLDRIDRDNRGDICIVDYKTGSKGDYDSSCSGFDELFLLNDNKSRKKGLNNVFELLFYCWLMYEGKEITPKIIYLSNIKNNRIKIGSERKKEDLVYNKQINDEFESYLKGLVSDLLDIKEGDTYPMKNNDDNCKYCPYKLFCN